MLNFTNESIAIETLPKHETVQLTKPNKAYWKVIVINLLCFFLVLGAGLATLIVFEPEVNQYKYVMIGSYFVGALLLFVVYRASFLKRGYGLREKDVIYKSGIIAETTTIVPLNRIQHVALDEGVLSRIFKLGKLQIYTAGGQSGHLMIAGIEIERAKKMRDSLLRKLDQLENTVVDERI